MTEKAWVPPAKVIDIHNHLFGEDDGSKMIELMNRSHIETTLIMGTRHHGNDAVLRAVQKFPGRLVGGVYADPRQGREAIDTIRHYHGEGFRVVKLFPNFGYYPDDEELRPFFDAVGKLGMAVLSHCGWLGGSGANVAREEWAAYYSHPGRFEKVIRLYPSTVFILAHMGGIAGLLETVMLTTRTANTFVDCSPGQGIWALETGGAIAGSVPAVKLMWGADSSDQAYYMDRAAKALEKLGYGPNLDKIFYANARGVLERIGAVPKAKAS